MSPSTPPACAPASDAAALGHANPRRATGALHAIARDLGIALDTRRTSVFRDKATAAHADKPTVCVAAAVATVPENEAARTMLQSALHAAIHAAAVDEALRVKVVVTVPPAAPPRALQAAPPHGVVPSVAKPVSLAAAVAPHAAAMCAQDSDSPELIAYLVACVAFDDAISALPWRDSAAMRARAPALLAAALERMDAGIVDPVLASGNVDALLTPIEALLPVFDAEHVRATVASVLGRPAASLFELYKTAYALRFARRTPAVQALCVRAFSF